MSSVLFVDPGPEAARDRFRRERRGDWAQALPLILEKHGLMVDLEPPEVLERPDAFNRHAVALVPRLPQPLAAETLERARRAPGLVLVDGPPNAALAQALDATIERDLERDGYVAATDPELIEAAEQWSSPLVTVSGPLEVDMNRRPELNWQEIAGVPLEPAQAEAWLAPGWDAAALAAGADAAVLAEWTPVAGGEPSPAVVRRDALVGFSFSLFAFLGHRVTSAPFARGLHFRTVRATGAEAILLGLIDLGHRRAARLRARLRPWPAGIDWVRTVRHDFDRPLSKRAVRAVLRGHKRAGTHATWYFRARHARRDVLRRIARGDRHEVALHTEMLWLDDGIERRTVEQELGRPILGSSAHGGRDWFGFQGAPNVLWAEGQGLRYTELLQHGNYHPFRFAAMGPDGTISPLRTLCLPQHESFDWSMRPGHNRIEALEAIYPDFIAAGALLQIMNHPDVHTDALFPFLESMPSDGRADWTAARAIHWWAATHVRDTVTLRTDGERVVLRTEDPVHDLTVELLTPDGRVLERNVSTEARRAVELQS
jgi:hypothetical protein